MNAVALALFLVHGDSVSSSRIEIDGREARVTFTFSMEDLAELVRLDPDRSGVVEPGEWKRALPAIFSYLGERFRIEGCRGEGDPDVLPGAVATKDGRAPVTLRMRYVSPIPIDRLRIRCGLFREHEGNPRHVMEGPGGRVVVFDRERREAEEPISGGRLRFLWTVAAVASVTTAIAAALARFVRRG